MPNKTAKANNRRPVPKQPAPRRVLAKCAHCGEKFRVLSRLAKGSERLRYCSHSCNSRAIAMALGMIDQRKKVPSNKKPAGPAQAKETPAKFARASRPKLSDASITGKEVAELRRSLGFNQSAFWSRLGVRQSSGSRYENDRPLPKPLAILLDAVYIKNLGSKQPAPIDLAILDMLKTEYPDLYAKIRKAVRRMAKN